MRAEPIGIVKHFLVSGKPEHGLTSAKLREPAPEIETGIDLRLASGYRPIGPFVRSNHKLRIGSNDLFRHCPPIKEACSFNLFRAQGFPVLNELYMRDLSFSSNKCNLNRSYLKKEFRL